MYTIVIACTYKFSSVTYHYINRCVNNQSLYCLYKNIKVFHADCSTRVQHFFS